MDGKERRADQRSRGRQVEEKRGGGGGSGFTRLDFQAISGVSSHVRLTEASDNQTRRGGGSSDNEGRWMRRDGGDEDTGVIE